MNKQWILAGVIAVVLVIAGVVVYASQNGGVVHLPGWIPGQSYVAIVQVRVQRGLSNEWNLPLSYFEGSYFNVKITAATYDYGLSILSQTPPLFLEADVKLVVSSYDSKGNLIDSVMQSITLGVPLFTTTTESYLLTVKLGSQRVGRTIKAILYPPNGTNILCQDSWVTT